MELDLRATAAGVRLRVRVQPRSARDAVMGIRAGALVVRLTAPPVDGEANSALVRFLGRVVGLPASGVRVLRGATGRDKLLELDATSLEQVQARLRAALEKERR